MSAKPQTVDGMGSAIEAPGPVHQISRQEIAWSVANAGEVTPGVQKPLSWAYWINTTEQAMRRGWRSEGILTQREAAMPVNPNDASQYYLGIFYGRAAINVDLMRINYDRRPGMSGDDFEKVILGSVRPGVTSRQQKSRYPLVHALRPLNLLTVAHRIDNAKAMATRWWRSSVEAAPSLDYDQAATLYHKAADWSVRVGIPYVVGTSFLMSNYSRLGALTHEAGVSGMEQTLAAGSGGGHDIEIVTDLWEVSRGRKTLTTFLDEHGYHCPAEGDLSSRTWREEPRPMERLVQSMTAMSDDEAPHLREQERLEQRRSAVRGLLEKLPKHRRPSAALFLQHVANMARLRNIGKSTIMRCLDVGRAASRQMGLVLAKRGLLDEPDDIYYLVPDEIFPALVSDARHRISERRKTHQLYEQFELPDHWIGNPVPQPVVAHAAIRPGHRITGVAASPGVAEGRVRVVRDPATSEELDPGEILVCRTTDPSWGAYFLVAGGLVIDIGGPGSHGAVIARELGVPCVINTRNGTGQLCDGDIVRVDGTAGTVELLSARSEAHS